MKEERLPRIEQDAGILYVSDLDGTLLGSDGRISENTARLLNPLLRSGLPFTVATARTAATALELLRPLELKLPVILLNGVLLYDMQRQQYLLVREIAKPAARKLAALFQAHGRDNFMFAFTGQGLGVFYRPEQGKPAADYRTARTGTPHKTFLPVQEYGAAVESAPIVFFNAVDSRERLEPLYHAVQEIEGVRSVFYQDTYGERPYYLEVFDERASKSNAVAALQELLGVRECCCFGDNLNDLDMLRQADRAYAVANAAPPVLEAVDAVIGSNDEDGVARFLCKEYARRLEQQGD